MSVEGGRDICAEHLSTILKSNIKWHKGLVQHCTVQWTPAQISKMVGNASLRLFFISEVCVLSRVWREPLFSSQHSPHGPPQPPLSLHSPCSREQELEQMLLWIKRSCERKFGQAAPFCRPDPAAAPGCELSVCIAGDELQNHQQRWRRQKQERFKTGGNHFTRKISAISGRKLWKMLPFPSQNEGKIKLLPVRRAKVASPSRESFDNGKHLTAGLELLSCSNSCYGLNEYFW